MQKKRTRKRRKQGAMRWYYLMPLFIICIIMVVLIWPKNKTSVLKTEHTPGNAEGHSTPTPTLPPGWDGVPNARELKTLETLGNRVIFFEKKANMKVSIVKDDYVHGKIVLEVEGLTSDHFSTENLKSVYSGKYAAGKEAFLRQAKDDFSDVVIAVEPNGDSAYKASIAFEEINVFECHISEDEYYVYLDFYKPRELYDTIILVDAGHGTPDPGTSSSDGVREKDLTLAFLLGIKEKADAQNRAKFYYTRLDDSRLYEDYSMDLHRRVDLANILEADLFLSIHFNSFESTKRNGTEAYYNEEQNDWATFNSKKLANILLDKTSTALGTIPAGCLPAATLYTVVKESQVPVTLIEVAYLSNANDLAIVTDKHKQEAASRALFSGLMEAVDAIEADRAAGTIRYPNGTPTPKPTEPAEELEDNK